MSPRQRDKITPPPREAYLGWSPPGFSGMRPDASIGGQFSAAIWTLVTIFEKKPIPCAASGPKARKLPANSLIVAPTFGPRKFNISLLFWTLPHPHHAHFQQYRAPPPAVRTCGSNRKFNGSSTHTEVYPSSVNSHSLISEGGNPRGFGIRCFELRSGDHPTCAGACL
jgi:hypothetical protein